MGVDISVGAVEQALACVQTTLDKLTARGNDAAAFDLARAQYAASIRSSWPGNLSSLVSSLEKIVTDQTLQLSAEERAELTQAIGVFREVKHP
jgi:hypothetical protein